MKGFDHSECDHEPLKFPIDLTPTGLRLDLLGFLRFIQEHPMDAWGDWLDVLIVVLEASTIGHHDWLDECFTEAFVNNNVARLDDELTDLLRGTSE